MKKQFKIAIIGGGAAGMMCAYLLNKAGHHVSVFEKHAVLGGNIKTTNKNLAIDGLDPDLFVEGGVVEFPEVFHNFKKILTELEVKTAPVPVGSGFFTKSGNAYLSVETIRRNKKGLQKIRALFYYFILKAASIPLWLKARNATASDLHNKSLGEVLNSSGIPGNWVRNLTMYSYSIPFSMIDDFPAEIAIPAMRDYRMSNWFRIEGGVYTYVERILESFRGEIHCNAGFKSVERTDTGVIIRLQNGEYKFDKVVFATPPDQVLKLLSDPSGDELHRFREWKENLVSSIIHTDNSFYKRFNIKCPSEFDFFETENGWGYNAWLNGLCSIKGDTPYNLAYNLESLIDPGKILHIEKHRTPLYDVQSFRSRNEIIETNGENNTYHAGAYLGDGLHEGAAVSAFRVAELIGKL